MPLVEALPYERKRNGEEQRGSDRLHFRQDGVRVLRVLIRGAGHRDLLKRRAHFGKIFKQQMFVARTHF